MWPVITLSFFLQLTDEEQLFARIEPVLEEQCVEAQIATEPAGYLVRAEDLEQEA